MKIFLELIPDILGLIIGTGFLVYLGSDVILTKPNKAVSIAVIIIFLLAGICQSLFKMRDYIPYNLAVISYTVVLVAIPLSAVGITMLFNEFFFKSVTAHVLVLVIVVVIIADVMMGRMFSYRPYFTFTLLTDARLYSLACSGIIAAMAVLNVADIQKTVTSQKALLTAMYVTAMILCIIMALIPNQYSLWPALTVVTMFHYVFLAQLQFVTDNLTGVMNANAFSRMIYDFQPTARTGIALVQLTRLNEYNQEFGRRKGDTCLQRVGRQLTVSFAGRGKVFRLNGSQFCVICPQTDKDELQNMLSEACRQLHRQLSQYENKLGLTSGYTLFESKDVRLTATLNRAEKTIG